MITSSNIVQLIVDYRCFKYYIPRMEYWLAYETLPEEGEGVKKLLGKFETEDEVDKFLEDYKAKLKEHIASLIVVVDTTENRMPPPKVSEIRKTKPPKRKQCPTPLNTPTIEKTRNE